MRSGSSIGSGGSGGSGQRRARVVRAAALVSAMLLALPACQTTEPNSGPLVQPSQSATAPAPVTQPAAPAPAPAPVPSKAEEKPATPPPAKIGVAVPEKEPLVVEEGPQARRVALMLPLSGRGAQVGRALLDAAQLALFEAAADDLELLVFDTQGTTAGAEDAARLAAADGARLILGPLFGASAEAVRPVAAAAGINVVSFSNNRDVAGDGVYVLGFLPDQQIERIVSFAARRGYGTLGALVPADSYGELSMAAARVSAEREGTRITKSTYYDPGDPDLSPLIREFANYDARKADLKRQRALLSAKTDQISRRALQRLEGRDTLGDPPYEALLLPAGGAELRNIAPLLAFYDVDPARVRLLGTAQWDGTRGLATEPALMGGWYAAPPPDTRFLFEDKFEQAYGRRPVRLASLGYDAMLLAVALSQGVDGPDYATAALTDARGFAGVDGIFRFLPDGGNQRGLAVLEVKDREVQVIDPAPTSFDNLGL